MKLVHHSHGHTLIPRDVAQAKYPTGFKPAGLWLSDEDDYGWAEWCRHASYPLAPHRHEVVLKPEANLLRITQPAQLLAFHRRYARNILPDEDFVLLAIDWVEVAETYAGILITPYQWESRMNHEMNWYYGWDCASGCIWQADAIASVQRLADVEERQDAE